MAIQRSVACQCVLVFAVVASAGDNWSLQPVQSSAPPKVQSREWMQQPLDAFVLSKLEAAALSPASRADRRTLIRRLTFDLLGLPPKPEQIDAFLSDTRIDAYERLVDQMLASPEYGERWGRHWLDVARFSESQGFERDKIRDHAWRYRDYVINSLNSDKPYDRFVTEQLAGDTLADATPESIVATGFLVAGPYDEAGNGSASALLRAKIREEELEDIISAVSQTFLGLTVNCARCHDHKFDPIPARDYYRLHSVFAGVKHGDRSVVTPLQKKLRSEQAARLQQEVLDCEKAIEMLENLARGSKPDRTKFWPADLPKPMARWTFDKDGRDEQGKLHAALHGGAAVRDGRLKLNGRNAYAQSAPLGATLTAKTLEAWVVLPIRNQRGGGVIGVEAKSTFDAIVFGERQPRKWLAGSDFFRRTRDVDGPEEDSQANSPIHVAVVYSSDGRIQLYRNGKAYGEGYKPAQAPVTFDESAVVLFGLRHHGGGNAYLEGEIEEARLYDRDLSAAQVDASFRAGVSAWSKSDIEQALPEAQRKRYVELLGRLNELQSRKAAAVESPMAYAVNSKQPEPTAILLRGDVEKRGAVQAPGGLSAVSSLRPDLDLSPDAPEGDRRHRFAEWVTSPRNPLTARVLVNRVWHYHFGRGIVGTPNDFGVNGESPSHPELLDWLADDFIRSGWSLKHLHRRILLSATYQQSSAVSDSKINPQSAIRNPQSIDADNRLLWRFPLRRLEAETIRDAMLSAGGNLQRVGGGPGYRPFKVTVFNSSFYDLVEENRPEFFRRTVYRIGVQSAKQPLLESFDCPEPSVKSPRRNITTTPLQALGLMNNAFVQQQSRRMSERIPNDAGAKLDAQVTYAFRATLGRQPSDVELDRHLRLAREHGLETVCWVLFNCSEFLYVR
jgi:hypothetical protein